MTDLDPPDVLASAPASQQSASDRPGFLDLPDLAGARFGGTVVAVSDEFFGSASRLLLPQAPVARPQTFTENGQWMDGWESRRRRGPGDEDWVLVRLGTPGIVEGVVVDTAFFSGNQPETAAVDGANLPGNPSPEELLAASWHGLLPPTPLLPSTEHVLPVPHAARVTHVRLRMAPDGGIARFRVHGVAAPALRDLDGLPFDLAAATSGARVTECSDMHFGRRGNLIAPGESRTMGEGWETRRRRVPGAEWTIIRLAAEGVVRRVVVDTRHFRGNAPAACDLESSPDGRSWLPLLPRTRLQPDQDHVLLVPDAAPARWLRLTIHPDGGVARLRAFGSLTDVGRREFGSRWLDVHPDAEAELLACCGSRAWARGAAALLPMSPGWDDAVRDLWWSLGPDDWREALAAHPRIGDRPPAGTQERREQSGAEHAEPGVLAAIAEGNRAYEDRFGFTYVVRASGRSAEEMLALLERRLNNSPDDELRVAAEQQWEITQLRMAALVGPPIIGGDAAELPADTR